jgi:hypothetical protein
MVHLFGGSASLVLLTFFKSFCGGEQANKKKCSVIFKTGSSLITDISSIFKVERDTLQTLKKRLENWHAER